MLIVNQCGLTFPKAEKSIEESSMEVVLELQYAKASQAEREISDAFRLRAARRLSPPHRSLGIFRVSRPVMESALAIARRKSAPDSCTAFLISGT